MECELYGRYNTKKKLILFSGGIDSTTILLQEAEKVKNTGKECGIHVLYIKSFNISTVKIIKEMEAIHKIVSKVEKDFGIKINIIKYKDEYDESEDTTISMSLLSPNNDKPGIMLPQTWFWLGTLIRLLPIFNSTSIEILFGFCMDDDFPAHSMYIIKNVISNILSTMLMIPTSEVDIHCSAPLMSCDKNNIYKEIIRKCPEYIPLIWSCECPDDGKECGKCNPCILKYHTINTLLNLEIITQTDINKAGIVLPE